MTPRDGPMRHRRRPVGGLEIALGQVGDRWTLLVVNALLGGPRRFSDLEGDLGGIAPNVLTQRLRQLEADGLIVAQAYSDRPVRHAYELTAPGQALADTLRLLAHWGAENGAAPGQTHEPEPVVHQACGTPAGARWWCSTCERVVDDDELDEVQWL